MEKTPASFTLSDELKLTIPKKILPYLKKDPKDTELDPHLFEFFVYQKMFNHLDKGRLCCNESVSYCDIDHDLVNEDFVDNVDKIALEFGYPNIPIYCDQHLDEAVDNLNNAWDRTTKRIQLKENTGFKIIENKTCPSGESGIKSKNI